MELQHHVHRVADALAKLPQRFQTRLDLPGSDVLPPFSSAIRSKGQIFRAVMPCSSRSSANSPALFRKPWRSSYGPLSDPSGKPQLFDPMPAPALARSHTQRKCYRSGPDYAPARRGVDRAAIRSPGRTDPKARCLPPSCRASRPRDWLDPARRVGAALGTRSRADPFR